MIAVLGFAGLSVSNGSIELRPHLPAQIKRLQFPITLGNKHYLITVTHEGWKTEEL